MTLSRRSFLGWLAASVPSADLVRLAHDAAVKELQRSPRAMLALGEAVLPSELGAAGIKRAVDEFQRWMTDYRESAELNHGYGTSRLQHSGPTPATRWLAQLDQLDAAATSAAGKVLADLPVERRRALVREALRAERIDRLPSVASARHVAAALLAHFYGSPAAADLCYEARIGRRTCRPLAAAPRKPLPLAGGRHA